MTAWGGAPALVVLVLLAGCGTGEGSPADSGAADAAEADSDCPAGNEIGGTCFRSVPLGTPPDLCPGGVYGEAGICAPAAPALVSWTCPAGWEPLGPVDREERIAPFTTCAPLPPAGDCEAGFMPRVGERGCVRQGLECPSGGAEWPDEATLRQRAAGFDGDIHYVRADAVGGTGTRDRPYGSLGEAFRASFNGDIIALSTGDLREALTLDKRVALVGACS